MRRPFSSSAVTVAITDILADNNITALLTYEAKGQHKGQNITYQLQT